MDGVLAVGNIDNAGADGITGYLSLTSTAFVVELATGTQIPIQYPDRDNPLVTHTAYGIWANGNGSYTIAGGSGAVLNQSAGAVSARRAHLVDYDHITGAFTNYTTFAYNNRNNTDLISHFEGIYRTRNGRYRLPATSAVLNREGDLAIASVATVRRNARGGFRPKARWQDLHVTRSSDGAASVLTTANSQYGKVTVGFANYPDANGTLDFVAQPA